MAGYERVMILGGPGSGKSTLARKFGARAGLPVIYLDRLFFGPDWQERPAEEFRHDHDQAIAAPKWVIDGNYSHVWLSRSHRAQLIIFIDLPTGLRMWRIYWRILRNYGRARAEMPKGCVERFDPEFLRYAREYEQNGRLKVLRLIELCKEEGRPRCVILRSTQAVAWFERNYLLGGPNAQ